MQTLNYFVAVAMFAFWTGVAIARELLGWEQAWLFERMLR